jgi:hypothetical protein
MGPAGASFDALFCRRPNLMGSARASSDVLCRRPQLVDPTRAPLLGAAFRHPIGTPRVGHSPPCRSRSSGLAHSSRATPLLHPA